MHRSICETWGCSGEWLSLGIEEEAWSEAVAGHAADQPSLDRVAIERYVLRRVFDLGWTPELFGNADRRHDVDAIGLSARRESIGRKYQWIAYREVLGLVADHFQYREYPAGQERAHRYQGPWQNWLRDIDPSSTAPPPRRRVWSYREGDQDVWWTGARYEGWVESGELGDWVRHRDDLPQIEDLLVIQDPDDGTRWLNGSACFAWKQAPPVGRELFEVERGEVRWWINAYLTGSEDAGEFMDWARVRGYVDAGIEDVREVYGVFIGEHGWGPAAEYRQVDLGSFHEGARPSRNAPVHLEAVATKYPLRLGRRDDHVGPEGWIQLPASSLVEAAKLRWSGAGTNFVAPDGRVSVFDPSAKTAGPTALLMGEEFARELIERRGLGMVWTVVCVKSVRLLDPAPGYPVLRLSGAYRLTAQGVEGGMRGEEIKLRREPWWT